LTGRTEEEARCNAERARATLLVRGSNAAGSAFLGRAARAAVSAVSPRCRWKAISQIARCLLAPRLYYLHGPPRSSPGPPWPRLYSRRSRRSIDPGALDPVLRRIKLKRNARRVAPSQNSRGILDRRFDRESLEIYVAERARRRRLLCHDFSLRFGRGKDSTRRG